MPVRQQTNLVKRGNVFYFRKKVPKDLRKHYQCESIRKSLRSFSTLAEAKREAGRLADSYEAEFEAIRRGRSKPSVQLTSELVPLLARALEAHILEADEEARIKGMSEEEFAATLAQTSEELQAVRNGFARGDASSISAQLEDWLGGFNIDVDPTSPTAAVLRRKFHEARLRALQGVNRRNAGDIVEVPPTEDFRQRIEVENPTSVVSTSRIPRLTDVIRYWKTTGEKSHRSTAAAETLVAEFVTLNGDLPLKDIGKAHFVALRDKMLQRVSPATVQARFNLLKAAFTVCRCAAPSFRSTSI